MPPEIILVTPHEISPDWLQGLFILITNVPNLAAGNHAKKSSTIFVARKINGLFSAYRVLTWQLRFVQYQRYVRDTAAEIATISEDLWVPQFFSSNVNFVERSDDSKIQT